MEIIYSWPNMGPISDTQRVQRAGSLVEDRALSCRELQKRHDEIPGLHLTQTSSLSHSPFHNRELVGEQRDEYPHNVRGTLWLHRRGLNHVSHPCNSQSSSCLKWE